MANTTVGASVQVEFASIGQMRKAIKEATSELIVMTDKFGATSEQAIAAAKKVAGLKDAIGDAKALADTFNPDKKFVALGGALQGAVAGFSALQGAIGLFGTQSKEVEKVLLKVQSAMALQQGISGIAGAMDSFNMLAGTIKTKVVTAFSTLRGAIMATGIGALGIALTLVIANFDEFKKKIFSLIPGLESITNFVGGLVTKFTDFVGITSEAERNLDKFTKANKRVRETIEAQIKILEAQGGQEEKVYALKRENIEKELNDLREAGKAKGKLTEEEQKQIRDLKNEQQLIDIEEANRKKKLNEDAAKEQERIAKENEAKNKERAQKREAAQKVIDDAQLSLLSDRQRAEEEILNQFEERKKVLQAGGIKDFTAIEKQRDNELKVLRKQFSDEDLAKEKEFQDQLNELVSKNRIDGIKDTRQKQVEELKLGYEEQRTAINENEKLTTEQRIALLAELKTNERLAMQQLEAGFAMEDEEKKILKLEKEFEDEATTFQRKKEILDEEAAIFKEQLDSKAISEEEYNNQIALLSEQRIKITEAESEARMQAAQAVSGTLSKMSELAGQETEAGRALAIAAATIDTYTAAVAAYKAGVSVPIIGMVMGPINAALAVAAGIANINKIASVKVAGKSGSGSAAASVRAGSPVAAVPTPTVVAQTLNTQAINQLGNQSARAYVLNSDMQNNEQRNAYLQRNARLG